MQPASGERARCRSAAAAPPVVHGTLYDAYGAPVTRRSSIILWMGDDPPDPPVGGPKHLKVATDARGRFRIEAPTEGGRFTLCAWGGALASFDLAPGQTRQVDLVRQIHPVISGRVRSGGRPEDGVMLYARHSEQRVLSDCACERRSGHGSHHSCPAGIIGFGNVGASATGEYQITLPYPGRWRVSVVGRHTGLLAVRTSGHVGYGGRAILDFDLPSGSIEGRVIDTRTGRPLDRARVLATGAGLERPLTATSSCDGVFRLDNVPDGKWSLRAEILHHISPEVAEVLVAGGRAVEGVSVPLTRGALVGGTVGGSGFPWVWAYPLDGQGEVRKTNASGGNSFQHSLSAYRKDDAGSERLRTPDARRRFQFLAMPAGRWRIVVCREQEWVKGAPSPATSWRPVPQLSLERTVTILGDEFVELDFPEPPEGP
ncbi:MAG: carboxypeptidase-like regulatory domain-containing protein [Planctomycetota bacterium]